MYILKPEMANELRKEKSTIFVDTPETLLNEKYIVTVGDICTLKIVEQLRTPNLIIVDYKTKKNERLSVKQKIKIDNIDSKIITVKNPPGSITEELWNAINDSLNSNENTKIIVKGEEDLATLPVISMAKIGTKVIYGMPDKGMIVVDVNQQSKKRANDFLNRMLVK